jgi:mRNA-degrading endonuclease RelE of RelBE toxin-antitoxin system
MKKKFELVFTREFLRRLKRLDRQVQVRILRELKVLESDPSCGKHLLGLGIFLSPIWFISH